MQKAAFLPAGTPNDVVATFNAAFKKVVNRQILQKSRQNVWVSAPSIRAATGEALQKL